MKKRLLAMLLATALVCALLPTTALAANSDFTIENGVLTKYNGPGGDVVIPNGVTSIGEQAFYGCGNLTSVVIPNGVTAIGTRAFVDCYNLASVTIPSSVTSMGDRVFYSCYSLTSVTIPNGVTSIGERAFYNCKNLTSLTIGNGVTTIGNEAFLNCENLTNVTIGNNVTSIKESAFRGCKSLTGVTIPDSVTTIGEQAFYSCTSLTGVTIPDSVTSIGGHAFSYCESLTSVTIGNGVIIIGWYAFSGCQSLTSSLTIPASVAYIGQDAFRNCSNLTTICGAEGSYAQLWAMDNGYDFQATLPPAITPGRTAYAAIQKIWVDGTAVEFQAYALKDENGNLTNYVKLRDVASVLNGTAAQFQVGWDGSKVTITTGTAYTPVGSEMTTPYTGDRTYADVGGDSVKLNGGSRSMASLVLKDAAGGGYTYYKLRDLGKLLDFNVSWSPQWGIYIETNKPYDPNT